MGVGKRVLILSCFLLLLLTASGKAAELPEEFSAAIPEESREAAQQDFSGGIQVLLEKAAGQIREVVRAASGGITRLMLVVLLCAVGEIVIQETGARRLYLNLAAVAGIVTVTAGDLQHLMGLGTDTIRQLDDFSKALLPTMAAASAASGSVGAAAARQAATVLFCDILITLIHRLLLPLLQLYVGALAAAAILDDDRLTAAANAIQSIASWSLKGLLTVFTFYLSVSGIAAGAADAAAVKAAKAAISGTIPVAGGIISGAAETVLASAAAVKGTIGIAGILVIFSICLTPFLRLGIQYLLYKAASFAAATVAESGIVKLISGLSSAFGLILGMTGSCAVLLLISLLSSLLAVSV